MVWPQHVEVVWWPATVAPSRIHCAFYVELGIAAKNGTCDQQVKSFQWSIMVVAPYFCAWGLQTLPPSHMPWQDHPHRNLSLHGAIRPSDGQFLWVPWYKTRIGKDLRLGGRQQYHVWRKRHEWRTNRNVLVIPEVHVACPKDVVGREHIPQVSSSTRAWKVSPQKPIWGWASNLWSILSFPSKGLASNSVQFDTQSGKWEWPKWQLG